MKRDEALAAILTERRRQVDEEGWTAEHDRNAHCRGELAIAAACYAHPKQLYGMSVVGVMSDEDSPRQICFTDPWPFNGTTILVKSRKDRNRQLVVAAALILAELERLDGTD